MIIYPIYAISNFLYVYTIMLFLSAFLGEMRLGRLSYMFYCAFYIVDYAIYRTAKEPIIFTISSIIMFYLLTFIHSKPNLKSISATFIISIIIGCSECIASGILALLNQIVNNLNYTYATSAAILCARLMFFLMTIIFNRILHRKQFYIHNPSIYITPVLSLILLLLLVLFSNTYAKPLTTTGNILLFVPAILLIAVNILVFYIWERQSKIYILQIHNDILNNTINMQQQQYKSENQIRTLFHKEKHDYKNLMIGLKSELESGNIDKAIAKIDEHIGALSKSPISNSGCYPLDSIINYKGELADSYGITIKTNFELEEELTVSGDDLCVLFGIALDNAIEYLSAHKELSQVIRITVNVSKGVLTFDISNSVAENINIKDNRIPSSKNSPEHGYGLESAKHILKKYGGELFLSCRQKVFHFGVSMCMEEV